MFGKVAYRGSFNRRSALITVGILHSTTSRPPSISLVTLSLSPSFSIYFEQKKL